MRSGFRSGILWRIVCATLVLAAGAVKAEPSVTYDWSGVADYGSIRIATYDYAMDSLVGEDIDASLIGTEMSGQFVLTPAGLPPFTPDDFYYALYNLNNPSPPVLTSQSTANFDSRALGVATEGTYFSQFQASSFIPDIFTAYFADYAGNYFGPPVIDYWGSGIIRSETNFNEFNTLQFDSGPPGLVGGRLVPVIGTTGYFTISSYFSQILYDECGTALTSQVMLWTLSGPGSLRISAPAVPEPASWALMVAGFAVVGFAVRRQNRSAGRQPAR